MITAIAGALAGIVHVLSGPDHLAAVAPLSLGAPRAAVRTGVAWGAGHGAGVIGCALLAWAARSRLDIDTIGAGAEWLVGWVLIAVGGATLLRAARHGHPVADPAIHRAPAAFGVGLLHGVAGVGHVVAVLPSLALGPADAAAYLTGYVVAAIGAMAAFGAAVSGVGGLVPPAGRRGLVGVAGAVAVGIGGWWLAVAA